MRNNQARLECDCSTRLQGISKHEQERQKSPGGGKKFLRICINII